jgi:threonine aldolase
VSDIDLRSDTVTLPTAEMMRAMTHARLGDDVFGDDPTVNRLEETAAERMGKEAAMFVPSGTMGNLLGLLVSARSGQEVIADADSHLFMNEAAGAAVVGGIQVRQVPTERGVLSPAQVLAALRPRDGGQHAVRASREDQASQALAQDAGRGHAAGRGAGRGRPGGPGHHGGPAGR